MSWAAQRGGQAVRLSALLLLGAAGLTPGCSDPAGGGWPRGRDGLEQRGQVVFLQQECARCHDGRAGAPPGACDLRRAGGLRSAGWHALHLFAPELTRPDLGHPAARDLFAASAWDPEDPRASAAPRLTADGRALVAYLLRLQCLPERWANGHSELPALGEHWLGPDDLFRMFCSGCHGSEGNGDGPGAVFLTGEAAPRAFRPGLYRVRSAPGLPTDEDLMTTLARGLPGTAMPDFPQFSGDDRRALVEYLKGFARHRGPDGEWQNPFAESPREPLPVPIPPEPTPALLAQGEALLVSLRCAQCHGEDLAGRRATELGADWRDEVGRTLPWATDLLKAPFKGGDSPSALYRLLMLGEGGAPMPSYAEALPDEADRWAVVLALRARRDALGIRQE